MEGAKPESAPKVMTTEQLVAAAREKRPEAVPQLQMRLDEMFGSDVVTLTDYELFPEQRVLVVRFDIGNGHTGEIVYSI